MPYSGAGDKNLPSNVKKLPAKKRRQWIAVFNSTYKKAISEGDSKKVAEGKAFRAANGVIKKSKEKEMENSGFIEQTISILGQAIGKLTSATSNDQYEISASINDPPIESDDDPKEEVEDGGDSESDVVEIFVPINLAKEVLTEGKPFDGLAPGEFIDMWMRDVSIDKKHLKEYLNNTKELIDSSTTESGEVVGLPIDAHGHDKGDGAGWIVGAFLEDNVLRFTPKWTKIGRELIESGVRRCFSATVDLAKRVVLGGTLTNWPASRDKKLRPLLRPIELSQDDLAKLAYKETEDDMDLTPELIAELAKNDEFASTIGNIVQTQIATALESLPPKPNGNGDDGDEDLPNTADFEKLFGLEGMSDEAVSLIKTQLNRQAKVAREQAMREWQVEIRQLQFTDEMTELAQDLVNGTETAPKGMRVSTEELKSHLLKLEPEEAKFWSDLLRKTQSEGFIEFSPVGSDGNPPSGSKELPEEYALKLASGELKIEDLSDPVLGLGDLEQYDLSKYAEVK